MKATRSNEGKACDAVIRYLEAREGSVRREIHWPEREGHSAPIELSCRIGSRLFAFEHTVVEPFEGQIEIEAKAHFQPLRSRFYGKIPHGQYYDLHVPADATLGFTRAQISKMLSRLVDWISAEGSKLELAPLGLKSTPVEREPDESVPFKVSLYRCALPGVTGQLSVAHLVDHSGELREARIRRACEAEFPKLAVWKSKGARTVLVLEGLDVQLTNPVDVSRAVLLAEESLYDKPDEIYFFMSAIVPWFFWHVRVDSRCFFDLDDPDERAWEVDPTSLSQSTMR